MTLMNEYGLLVAVALPVLAIVGTQVALFIGGERDTLLLPGLHAYPSIARSIQFEPVKPAGAKPAAPSEASNDEFERLAA